MMSQEKVQHIASLSKIYIDEAEASSLAMDLSKKLAYIEPLKKVNIASVEPTLHLFATEEAGRFDRVQPSFSQKEAMAFAIDTQEGFYKVPKVIE